MFTVGFWKDTAERVVSSAAGGAMAGLVLGDGLEQNWKFIGGGAALTGLMSLLKVPHGGWHRP